ncbi:MAG TPA: acyltransferase, partial [Chitinophagaceae bacterium]|nr:acyltransferase [Chitinophagaceae bacterium]
MSSKILHLKGLNGLRTIAALAVVVFHLTESLKDFNLNPHIFGVSYDGGAKVDLAGFGVTIFFSLSGFLITYLLLLEKEKTDVSIKKFYIRRALRIWPLYYLYLIVAIAFALIAEMTYDKSTLLYYVFFTANIPHIINDTPSYRGFFTFPPFVGHYWSLGVEEQFYIFWPLIIKFLKRNHFLIVGCITTILLFLKLYVRFLIPDGDLSLAYSFFNTNRFVCMMIGALGAILFFNKQATFLAIFNNKIAQFIAWVALFFVAINRFHIASVLDHEIISLVTVTLIIGQVTIKNRLISLENGIFDFLGKISYG